MDEQVLEAWDIHNHMLFMLFDAIPAEAFAGKPTGMTGRSVGNIFAHVNNIRLGWVEVGAPKLMDGLTKIATKTKAEREAITGEALRPALVESAKAMREMLADGLEKGKLRGFKPHLAASYSYFIAHEWYHIGEICMTLNEAGHKPNDEILYGIWSWGRWQPGEKQDTGDD